MEQLIPIINKLQDVLSAVGIDDPLDLPQIVVVGSQSSGKSSVLEALVGRDFLPRGTGIVTRRPLVLQLSNRKVPKANMKDPEQEWGEFTHLPGRKFHNFNEIRTEIERETDKIAGKNKGVSAMPIMLKIYSPNVVNLTLVDLPGLTKVPVGDQPKDIEDLIKNLIMKFIKKPNTIILAVSGANVDLANSDALKLAREVDPSGQRTLGVLTKLDLMDKGTDCLEILQGHTYSLRLGFIGLVLRSQADIVSNKPVTDALQNETAFFVNHPRYKAVAHKCGVAYLAKSLNNTLMKHIRDNLPDLKYRVAAMYDEKQKDLNALGDPRLNQSKGALLLHIINNFYTTYSQTIAGTLPDYALDELYGGARINYIFIDVFARKIDHMNVLGGLSTKEIELQMNNATGPRRALFVPDEAFDQLSKRMIRTLEEPALNCADLVYDELHQIVDTMKIDELERFDSLKDRIKETVHNLLVQCREPAKEMIRDMIAMEQAFINTNHPDFVGGGNAIQVVMQKRAQEDLKEKPAGSSHNPFLLGAPADIPPELASQYSQAMAKEKEKENSSAAAQKRREEEAKEQVRKRMEKEEKKAQQSKDDAQGNNFFSFLFNNKGSDNKKPTGAAGPSASTPASPAEHRSTSPQSRDVKSYPASPRPDHQNTGYMKPRQDDFQTQLIKTLLESYFAIARRTIADKTPKIIMHFMVNASRDKLHSELVQHLYKEDLFDNLLQESSDVADKREALNKLVEVLKRAQAILSEVGEVRM